MTIDRVATAQQNAYFLSQINQAGECAGQDPAADRQRQGRHHLCRLRQPDPGAAARPCRPMRATTPTRPPPRSPPPRPTCRTPSSPACPSLATQLKKAISDAVANNDRTTLMNQVQSIFDQATVDPQFQGRQWRLYLWRRQDRHAAGDGHLAVAAGGAARRCRAPSPMATPRNRCRWPMARPSPMASPPRMSAPA